MGGIFFRKLSLEYFAVISLFFVFAFSINVFAAVHPLYSGFSSPENGFAFNNASNSVFVSDTVIYRTGYYSVNGGDWASFELSGSSYNNNANWLSSSAFRSLPNFLEGEHYIIVYSCTYSSSNSSWNCHDNKWQLLIIHNSINDNVNSIVNNTFNNTVPSGNSSCGNNICKTNEYCLNGDCLLNVSGNTYFVSTTGNDNNPGNFTRPWKTWQKAVEVSQPGDITYIRGGVYLPTTYIMNGGWNTGVIGMRIFPSDGMGKSGTANKPIRYFAYPSDWESGNYPILDGSLMTPNSQGHFMGIDIERAEHIHLKGLTVRNINQVPYSKYGLYTQAWGIMASDVANIVYELLVVHDIDGVAYTHYSGAWNDLDSSAGAAPAFDAYFSSDDTHWINCDAYNLYDKYALTPGNAADGWKTGGWYGNNFTWEGCRAFNYSDDGFNQDNNAFHLFKNCWAMSTNKYVGLSELWDIEGNGWKVTGVDASRIPNYSIGGESFTRFDNCIAANNYNSGFGNNVLVEYRTMFPNNAEVYNCLSYNNSEGFRDDGSGFGGIRGGIYRNNIAYGSRATGWGYAPLYEAAIYRPSIYEESHNTWRHVIYPQGQDDWPGWEYNPAFTVTNDDFVSLDTSQLMRPRKADGSLPDITFGHLKADSDLIDSGIDVGLPYIGAAPDLGPFESR